MIGNKITAVDLFCGCGGLSLGFEDAGYEILSGNDIDVDAVKSFEINHPNAIGVCGDLSKIDLKKLRRTPYTRVDVVIGGPPCQSFSSVGDRKLNDPRGYLLHQFVKAVKFFHPKAFVLENVPGLLTIDKGELAKKIEAEFREIGYTTEVDTLKAEQFGVPQLRRRIFIVGNRLDKSFNFPIGKYRSNNENLNSNGEYQAGYLTVKDSLDDLPLLKAGESNENYRTPPNNDYQRKLRGNSNYLTYHRAPNHSSLMIERMRHIREGENHAVLPNSLKLKSGYHNIYGRLIWDEPSTTVTGNSGCVSAPGRFIHPSDDRAITVREAMRLQSFPDRWVVEGTWDKKYQQVGNAVPPLLAKAVAISVAEAFFGITTK